MTASNWVTAVLADSPWGCWAQNETSGSTLADSSANGNDQTITGTPAPMLGQTGPDGSTADGIAWPSNSSLVYAATSSHAAQPSTATMECWLYMAVLPASLVYLVECPTGSQYGGTVYMTLSTTGAIEFDVYNNAGYAATTEPLSVGAWHHVVASVGPAGMKVRVDKSTLASNANTAAHPLGVAGPVRVHCYYNGTQTLVNSGAVTQGPTAVWLNGQLTDAQTDAHYDAMMGGAATAQPPAITSTATVTAPALSAEPPAQASTASVTAPMLVAQPPPITSSAVATPPTLVASPPGITSTATVSVPNASHVVFGQPPSITSTTTATAPSLVVSPPTVSSRAMLTAPALSASVPALSSSTVVSRPALVAQPRPILARATVTAPALVALVPGATSTATVSVPRAYHGAGAPVLRLPLGAAITTPDRAAAITT